MPDTYLPFQESELLIYQATPEGYGPFPGVVVLHDALGMSTDVRRQCDWLASEGYMAAVPDLFSGKTFFSCMFQAIRELNKRKGTLFDKVETVRKHLLNQPQANGRVGVIGFCFGGGFAIILSAGFGFDSASINYGGLPKNAETLLAKACPIVASYGALDRTLKGTAHRLETLLTDLDVDHDIKEYPHTDHAFMNDHDPEEIPLFIKVFAYVVGGGAYHDESTQDARKRILAFFNRYLYP